jgi:hypothetical protein
MARFLKVMGWRPAALRQPGGQRKIGAARSFHCLLAPFTYESAVRSRAGRAAMTIRHEPARRLQGHARFTRLDEIEG